MHAYQSSNLYLCFRKSIEFLFHCSFVGDYIFNLMIILQLILHFSEDQQVKMLFAKVVKCKAYLEVPG